MKRTTRSGLDTFLGLRTDASNPRILVVGDSSQLQTIAQLLQSNFPVVRSSFENISANYLASTAPDIVVSTLATPRFDCLDLAHRLFDAGYLGRYRILTDDLPNPRILMNEILVSCPGLDAMVLTTEGLKSRLIN